MYTSDVSQRNFSQIGVRSAEIRILQFSQSTFFKIHTLYARFSDSIKHMPCILLEHVDMGTHYPILWKIQN